MTDGDLITGLHQVQWRDTLWGWPATNITMSGLSGWKDRPPARTQNTDRTGRHGQMLGPQRLGGRLIEVTLRAARSSPGWLDTVSTVCDPGDDPGEEPLVIWSGTDAPQLVFARVERLGVPTDQTWSLGDERAVIQWAATDHRRYGLTELNNSCGLPVAGGGLAFPLAFPMDFGSAPSGGTMTLVNSGNTATSPVWTVTGPVVGPIITNVDTDEQLLINPAYTLPDGQQMVLDVDQRSVLVEGVNRRDLLLIAQWFNLPKQAASTIRFAGVGAYDADARLAATWRDAYL